MENVGEPIYFSFHRGTSPQQVLQELVTGEIVAGWMELRLPPLALVVFVGMLPGVYDAVVNYSVYSDKRGVHNALRAARATYVISRI